MNIPLDVTEITLIAYACQEMSYRRGQDARDASDEMMRKNWLAEADQYRVIAERYYALSREAQLQGNQI